MNFIQIAKSKINPDKDYVLFLAEGDRGDVVCFLKSPADDLSDKAMMVDDGIEAFLRDKDDSRFNNYSFVVVDEDELWDPSWGTLTPDPYRTTKLIAKP